MSGDIPMSILKEILEGSPRGILGGVPEEISGKSCARIHEGIPVDVTKATSE